MSEEIEANLQKYPWQEQAWNSIRSRVEKGRMPHALLLTGPPGVGKMEFAQFLILSQVCRAPGSQGAPCHQCDGCRQYLAGSHPDTQLLDIEEKRKTLRVDQVRALSSWLGLTASHDAGKFALIAQADRMTQGASNSLLKTLEEPPGKTLLVLVSSLPGRLSATIRSRCQQLAIPRPERQLALDWLNQHADEDWSEALALAEGAPLRAQRLVRDGSVEMARNRSEQLIRLGRGRETVVSVAESWSKQPLGELIHWWRVWLQQLARWIQAGPDHAPALQSVKQEDLQILGGRIDCHSLHDLMNMLDEAERRLDSANPQLLLESLLGHWAQICGIIAPVASNRAR